MISYRLIITAVLAWISLLPNAVDAADGVRLPQKHSYQRILRDYLATLTERDFFVPLTPIDIRGFSADDEELYWLWVLTRSIPDASGIKVPASHFLLSTIESPDGIRMRAGKRGSQHLPGMSVHPGDTVWWSTWNYSGNPYRGSRAIRNRGFVIAAVDMIMLDDLHESGTHWVKNARRSDFLGGTLAWLVHVYRDVRADLPRNVQEAYEFGLDKFFDRLAEWGPTGVNDNMDMKALVAAAYVIETFGEGPLVDKARAYSKRVLGLVHPAGMIRDAGGVDASYNGIALFYVSWAAAVGGDPDVVEAERKMTDLKSHLTLPDPDGLSFWGPSHFNTRTPADSANDQWSWPQRDLSIAMRHDGAMYLMHGGRSGRGPSWAAPDRATMQKDISRDLRAFNTSLRLSNEPFSIWQAGWWSSGKLNFAYDYGTSGFYDRVRGVLSTRNAIVVPPVVRPGAPFVKVFPDPATPGMKPGEANTFVVAGFRNYAAIISAVPMGFHKYTNFPGGGLSALWTPSGGAMVLGRCGNPVAPDSAQQGWSDWRRWPTHALSGTTASGDAFSTARVGREVAEVECVVEGLEARATIRGPIGKQHDKGRSVQNGCITGDVRFERTFFLGPEGVEVGLRLESDGSDSVTELCEIIPLLLRDRVQQSTSPEHPNRVAPHHVAFRVGRKWVEPPDGFVDGVSAVRVLRFRGVVTFVFDEPQRVCLGEEWSGAEGGRVLVRNLLIDLLGSRGGATPLPDVNLTYRIEPDTTVEPVPERSGPWRRRLKVPAEGREEIRP